MLRQFFTHQHHFSSDGPVSSGFAVPTNTILTGSNIIGPSASHEGDSFSGAAASIAPRPVFNCLLQTNDPVLNYIFYYGQPCRPEVVVTYTQVGRATSHFNTPASSICKEERAEYHTILGATGEVLKSGSVTQYTILSIVAPIFYYYNQFSNLLGAADRFLNSGEVATHIDRSVAPTFLTSDRFGLKSTSPLRGRGNRCSFRNKSLSFRKLRRFFLRDFRG